jgi:CheY-like chemotaxis protein/anti-sigma regulatory factor (Ser/Thr protein kinase)
MPAQILVIDDDPVNLEVISEFLRETDSILSFATDGQEGWERLEDAPDRFDALILDRWMPRMDGIALTRRVVADPRFEDLPIIMQTAATSPEQVAEGLAAGAWYYLAKPFQAESLARTLSAALADRRNRLELRQLRTESWAIQALLHEGSFRFRDLKAARLLAAWLGNLCPRPAQVAMGLSELMINAVEHGNLGIDYAAKGELLEQGLWLAEIERRLATPEQRHRWAEVILTREPGRLCFAVRDQGPGFDWTPYLELAPERAFDTHGRGIAMARRLAFDTLEYQGCGNLVRVSVALG